MSPLSIAPLVNSSIVGDTIPPKGTITSPKYVISDYTEYLESTQKGSISYSEGGIEVSLRGLLILVVGDQEITGSHCSFLFPPRKVAGYAGCRLFEGTFRLIWATLATGVDPVTAVGPPVSTVVRIVEAGGNLCGFSHNRKAAG
jgi:hypothetical protein